MARTRALLNRSAQLREDYLAQRARALRMISPRWSRGGSTPDTADLEKIREQVRVWLTEGSLPPVDGTVWAGRGSGLDCAVCRGAIPLTDVEYEVVAGKASWVVHLACYRVWKDESAALATAPGG